jgi:hypothetical protein
VNSATSREGSPGSGRWSYRWFHLFLSSRINASGYGETTRGTKPHRFMETMGGKNKTTPPPNSIRFFNFTAKVQLFRSSVYPPEWLAVKGEKSVQFLVFWSLFPAERSSTAPRRSSPGILAYTLPDSCPHRPSKTLASAIIFFYEQTKL